MREDNRLIIVLGMAHSGTTILTYLLRQHPDTLCQVDGNEELSLETDYLPLASTGAIQALLLAHPTKRILLKRPWMEVWHDNWMRWEIPNAQFVYCYRSFEDIIKSWSKPKSMIAGDLRDADVAAKRKYYDFCLHCAKRLSADVPSFRWHYHPSLLAEKEDVLASLLTWLQLPSFKFDSSTVSNYINIKDIILRESKEG